MNHLLIAVCTILIYNVFHLIFVNMYMDVNKLTPVKQILLFGIIITIGRKKTERIQNDIIWSAACSIITIIDTM